MIPMIDLTTTEYLSCAHGTPASGITSSEQYRVLVVREGSGTFSLSGRPAEVVPDSVMLLAPYDLLYVPAEATCEATLFTFTSEGLYPTGVDLLSVFQGETYLHPARQTDGVSACISRMKDIRTADASRRAALVRLYLTELLLHISASPVPFDEALGVARAAKYLAVHLHEDVSLDDLSEAVGISKFYLCRAFSRDSGLTPHAYLNHLRAYRARTLLAGGMSAADVAISVGFSDYSTFFRTYRRIIGCTPTTRDNK